MDSIKQFLTEHSRVLTYIILVILGFLLFLDVEELIHGYFEDHGSIVSGILDNFLDRDAKKLAYWLLIVAYAFVGWKYTPRIEAWLFTR